MIKTEGSAMIGVVAERERTWLPPRRQDKAQMWMKFGGLFHVVTSTKAVNKGLNDFPSFLSEIAHGETALQVPRLRGQGVGAIVFLVATRDEMRRENLRCCRRCVESLRAGWASTEKDRT
jgi:hypothetical protein